MIVPVRCFTCGKVISHEWEKYQEGMTLGEESRELLDRLGVTRYCCRSILMTTLDLVRDIGQFKRN